MPANSNRRNIILRLVLVIVATLTVTVSLRAYPSSADPQEDSNTARPWTFWYWMYGAVSKEGIKADLQTMKDIGLGGCYLMPIRGPQERPEMAEEITKQFGGTAAQLSPRFWEMVDYALQQADSLQLQMGIHICDGFALAGGPWISPEESMKKIVWSEKYLRGKGKGTTIDRPESYDGYYEDIACYAIRLDRKNSAFGSVDAINGDKRPWLYPKVSVAAKGDVEDKLQPTIDEKGSIRSNVPCRITYEYDDPITVRSIVVKTPASNLQAKRLKILASDDGTTYKEVMQLAPPRQGWQEGRYNTTYSLPTTTARYFAFDWTPEGSEPGSEDLDAAKWKPNLKVTALTLSPETRISQWEGKAGYAWRIAAPIDMKDTHAPADAVDKKNIVPVTLAGDKIVTSLPKGDWRIVRIGHTSTGQKNDTAGEGKGLECDKFSEKAVNKQIDNWFHLFKQRPHADVIRYLHVDSWECGCQNWSSNFAEEFRKRRGYDLMPYLLCMTGIPVESVEKSDSVLRDVRLTINDLINDVFFRTVAERAKAYGCLFSSESVAPTMISDGIEHYKYCDLPMGEYWLNSPTHDKPNDMTDAVSGAHIYGKKIIQAEGFTEVRGVWDETPSSIKTLLDRNFCVGMNRLFFHVNTHNPWTDRRPGMTLDGIGLFFQRDQTWIKEAKGMVDYITRVQTLLQKGDPVADIAVFCGEEMPCRSVRPEQLTGILPGIIGEERVTAEMKRRENTGQPMTESPVGVRHSAGIPDPARWVNPLDGYAYDSMNRDALLNLTTAKDGIVSLPGGARYRILVLMSEIRDEAVRRKIDELRKAGVIIIDTPYHDSDFSRYGLHKDFSTSLHGDIGYTHRRIDSLVNVYFVSNQKDIPANFDATFRNANIDVCLYDAVTKKIIIPDTVRYDNGRCTIPLRLPPGGSTAVIFGALPQQPSQNADIHEEYVVNAKNWNIHFEDTGIDIVTDSLFDWSRHDDDKIKYYSGRAVYTTTFNYRHAVGDDTRMTLAGLHDVAHVWINDIDCGIAWTAPYEVDITKALRRGGNNLRIEVVNTWANALKGADEGKSPFNGIWTNAKYRRGEDSLLPAGLLCTPVIRRDRVAIKPSELFTDSFSFDSMQQLFFNEMDNKDGFGDFDEMRDDMYNENMIQDEAKPDMPGGNGDMPRR